jgi:hypothetical protein
MWSVQSVYEEVFGSVEQYRTEEWRVEFRDASLTRFELVSRGIELGQVFEICSGRVRARNELGSEKKSSCVI